MTRLVLHARSGLADVKYVLTHNTMTTRPHIDLSRLLTPQSIAIIGASSNSTSISGQPLRLMIEAGYAGKIYPVNPKRDEVQGVKAYPDAQSIPGPCDVALVAVSAAQVPQALRDCGKAGIPFAVVLAGGFEEIGEAGAAMQRELKAAIKESGVRVVPPAVARRGSYIAKGAILMPSYVNIGAYVDEGTMVDTWATVGSCAQVGKNVHLSGGVGLGGVLEPLQANPTIIEDNCFIGARSEIVEGVIVEENSVISMGVYIGQSTKIYDRATGQVHYGRVPAGSVVVSGNLPSADGKYSLYCAVIVKRVDAQTRAKTSLNELLRD